MYLHLCEGVDETIHSQFLPHQPLQFACTENVARCLQKNLIGWTFMCLKLWTLFVKMHSTQFQPVSCIFGSIIRQIKCYPLSQGLSYFCMKIYHRSYILIIIDKLLFLITIFFLNCHHNYYQYNSLLLLQLMSVSEVVKLCLKQTWLFKNVANHVKPLIVYQLKFSLNSILREN